MSEKASQKGHQVAVSSIFFIDDRVQDKEVLFSAIDASAKWFVLDSSLDGISKMQRILSSYRNLDSIQIISHGSTGAINIGSTLLNSTTLTNTTLICCKPQALHMPP